MFTLVSCTCGWGGWWGGGPQLFDVMALPCPTSQNLESSLAGAQLDLHRLSATRADAQAMLWLLSLATNVKQKETYTEMPGCTRVCLIAPIRTGEYPGVPGCIRANPGIPRVCPSIPEYSWLHLDKHGYSRVVCMCIVTLPEESLGNQTAVSADA